MRIPIRLVPLLALVACLVFAGSAAAEPSARPFELVPGSFHFAPSSDQAGAHADWVTSFEFAHSANGHTFNDLKTTAVNLPPGFIGNNTAIPTCTSTQLLSVRPQDPNEKYHLAFGAACPPDSQVGFITLDLREPGEYQTPVEMTFPLYNIETDTPGVAAELGFHATVFTQLLVITVRPGDSGLTVTSPDVEAVAEPHQVTVTVWGVPGAKVHDPQRGLECTAIEGPVECFGGGEEGVAGPKPFLTNPTSCAPFVSSIAATSWEGPGALLADGTPDLSDPNWTQASNEGGPIVGCERVHFDPSIQVAPTTNTAESPSGLNISLDVPQTWELPESLSTANLKATKLTLPVGYTINPSAGSGLGVCTPEELAAETFSSLPGEGCPQESKIGSIEGETPVLSEKLSGTVFVAKPYDNPFDSLLALYITVKVPDRGVIVKLAGHIEPNPVTGQLVTTFPENPQVPFSKLTIKLHQGVTSPLVSPPACGAYTAEADLTPWSEPASPLHVANTFAIEHGIGGGPCPPGGIPPFKPGLNAGTLNNNAGAYSPLDIRITRNDGEQEITRFSAQFPPGLTARLTGIPFCPDADIEAAKHVTGAQEETTPSCPKASEIGHSLVGAGVGSVLAYTPGKVYMAGPYNGQPFSIVAITSAKVGPFDLGTVVVREALEINPETAVVTVDAKASDPIPHIIDGIVIHVRDIHVYVDRPEFMINPTSCNPMSLAATVDGAGADPANPADQQPVTIVDSFQVANCQNLAFKPSFTGSTSGKTSKSNGASLAVKLTYPNTPPGTQANIARVKVDLPKQLPSRLTTLQKACTAAQFNANPAGCPAASFIGHAKAITPILPVPLEGPAIFVSHGGEAFPSLIMVLQGYGVTIDLVGSTFISKQGVTSSTFKTVPDQPVTSFELTLPEGKFSALAANLPANAHGSFCGQKLAMPTEFVAQNGAKINESTPVSVTGCAKKKALTRAQKLAAALKACHKQPKGKRAACQKAARKRYGPIKRSKPKSAAKGKKK